MKKFVENLIAEHRALFGKITRAKQFIANPENVKNLDVKEYAMLYAQIEAMMTYQSIVRDRLGYYNVAVTFDGDNISYYEKVK